MINKVKYQGALENIQKKTRILPANEKWIKSFGNLPTRKRELYIVHTPPKTNPDISN